MFPQKPQIISGEVPHSPGDLRGECGCLISRANRCPRITVQNLLDSGRRVTELSPSSTGTYVCPMLVCPGKYAEIIPPK